LLLPLAIALCFGRIANFINSELVGTVTNVGWCVVFPAVDNLCRHPVQLYEALKNLFIFGLLLVISWKGWKRGVLFWTFTLSYGILRFALEFFKQDTLYFGLTVAQYLCIPMVAFGLVFLIMSLRKK